MKGSSYFWFVSVIYGPLTILDWEDLSLSKEGASYTSPMA